MIKKGIIANQINEIIPPRDYKIFGVRGRNLTFENNTTDTLTRLEDSIGKSGGADFDNEPIYKDIKQVTIKNFIEITDGYRSDRNTFSSTTEMIERFTTSREDTFIFSDKNGDEISSPYGLWQYAEFAQVKDSGYGFENPSRVKYKGKKQFTYCFLDTEEIQEFIPASSLTITPLYDSITDVASIELKYGSTTITRENTNNESEFLGLSFYDGLDNVQIIKVDNVEYESVFGIFFIYDSDSKSWIAMLFEDFDVPIIVPLTIGVGLVINPMGKYTMNTNGKLILSKELIDKGFYRGNTGDNNDRNMDDGYYFVADASGVLVGSYLQVRWLYYKDGDTFTLKEERPTDNPFHQFLWSKVPYNPTQTPILNKVYKCGNDYYKYNGGETLTIADFDLVTVPDIDVIKIPKFYIKRTTDVNNVETELISDRQVDETWKIHPAFFKGGLEKDAFYISPTIFTDQAYKIPDSNYGDFTAMTFNQVEALFTLARVEYARFAEHSYDVNEFMTDNFMIRMMRDNYRGIALNNTAIKDFYMYSKQIGGDFNEIQNPFGSDTISINGIEYDANTFTEYDEQSKFTFSLLFEEAGLSINDDDDIISFLNFLSNVSSSFHSKGSNDDVVSNSVYFSYKGGINNNSFFPKSMLLNVTSSEETVNQFKYFFNQMSLIFWLNNTIGVYLNATLNENMELDYTFQKKFMGEIRGTVSLNNIGYQSSSIRINELDSEDGFTIRYKPFDYLIGYNEGMKLIPYKMTYTTPTRKRPLAYMTGYTSIDDFLGGNASSMFGRYVPKDFTGNSAYWDTLAKGFSFVEMEIGEEEVETLLTFTP